LGLTDDGLILVEGGVQDHRHPRELAKLINETPVAGVVRPAHGLQTAGAVHVGNRRDHLALLGPDLINLEHEGVGIVDLEVLAGRLLVNGRGKGPEGLAALDLEVQDILHVGPPRIANDAPVAQSPGAPLHAALEPTCHLAVGDISCGPRAQLVIVFNLLGSTAFFFQLFAPCTQLLADLNIPELRPQIGRGEAKDAGRSSTWFQT